MQIIATTEIGINANILRKVIDLGILILKQLLKHYSKRHGQLHFLMIRQSCSLVNHQSEKCTSNFQLSISDPDKIFGRSLAHMNLQTDVFPSAYDR